VSRRGAGAAGIKSRRESRREGRAGQVSRGEVDCGMVLVGAPQRELDVWM